MVTKTDLSAQTSSVISEAKSEILLECLMSKLGQVCMQPPYLALGSRLKVCVGFAAIAVVAAKVSHILKTDPQEVQPKTASESCGHGAGATDDHKASKNRPQDVENDVKADTSQCASHARTQRAPAERVTVNTDVRPPTTHVPVKTAVKSYAQGAVKRGDIDVESIYCVCGGHESEIVACPEKEGFAPDGHTTEEEIPAGGAPSSKRNYSRRDAVRHARREARREVQRDTRREAARRGATGQTVTTPNVHPATTHTAAERSCISDRTGLGCVKECHAIEYSTNFAEDNSVCAGQRTADGFSNGMILSSNYSRQDARREICREARREARREVRRLRCGEVQCAACDMGIRSLDFQPAAWFVAGQPTDNPDVLTFSSFGKDNKSGTGPAHQDGSRSRLAKLRREARRRARRRAERAAENANALPATLHVAALPLESLDGQADAAKIVCAGERCLGSDGERTSIEAVVFGEEDNSAGFGQAVGVGPASQVGSRSRHAKTRREARRKARRKAERAAAILDILPAAMHIVASPIVSSDGQVATGKIGRAGESVQWCQGV